MVPLPFVCSHPMTKGHLSFVVGMLVVRKQKLYCQMPIPGLLLPEVSLSISTSMCCGSDLLILVYHWEVLGFFELICRGFEPQLQS